jgi:hypothetical protein
VGNNGWGRNGQTEALMPKLLGDLEQAGLPLAQVKEAMASIGYGKHAIHELDRWESKRTTGKFGRQPGYCVSLHSCAAPAHAADVLR